MNTMVWTRRTVLLAALFALGVASNLAIAQVGDRSHIKYPIDGYTACLSLPDGGIWCDGGGVYYPPKCSNPGIPPCSANCMSRYQTAMAGCNRTTDPNDKANCIFLAEDDLRACLNVCSVCPCCQ